MYKSVVDALYLGTSKQGRHQVAATTGIFAASAVSRPRLSLCLDSFLRIIHKKIGSRQLLVEHFANLQVRMTSGAAGEANVAYGALPFFVQSQKRGAESCNN